MINIDWDWVMREVKDKERIGSNDAILSSFREALKTAKALASPKAITEIRAITASGRDFVEIAGGFRFSSQSLASHIKGSSGLLFFIVTIGGGLEQKSTDLMAEGDGLGGYLLDRIGSFAVESMAERLETSLRAKYEKASNSLTMRFSPGYCNWRLEDQRAVAQVLDFSKAGVELTSGCMMVPRKSISGVMGIGPEGIFKKPKSPCALCNKLDCDYKRD